MPSSEIPKTDMSYPKNWTPANLDYIINMIKKSPSLWCHNPYIFARDRLKRNREWEAIADDVRQKLGIDVNGYQMNEVWKKLKDSYAQAKKRLEKHAALGICDTEDTSWIHYKAMKFLQQQDSMKP